jgi:hypothetical protein
MKIKRQVAGQTLIILLIAVVIIALLTLGRTGELANLMGTKEKPGTVRVDLNKIQQETDSYNQRVKEQLEAGTAATGTRATGTPPIASSTEDYNKQLKDNLNN